jgi:hypothetical protein
MLLLGSPAVASVAVLAFLLFEASDVTGVLAGCLRGSFFVCICEKIEPCIELDSDYHCKTGQFSSAPSAN